MLSLPKETVEYIIQFLLYNDELYSYVYYGNPEDAPDDKCVIIVPSFQSRNIDDITSSALPSDKLEFLDNYEKTPILFGSSDVVFKKKQGYFIR